MTPSEIIEVIRDHISINELQEKEELGYDYVMKNYYPMVMLWLDENNLTPSAENISENKVEISNFVNTNTIDSLTEANNRGEGKSVKPVKKSAFPKILIVVAVLAVAYYFINKGE